MDTYTLVRTEHLNHFGYLFGGQMLKWVDEFAWLAATREQPGCTFVTRAMDQVAFQHQVGNGTILRFNCRQEKRGTTSVMYRVEVYAQAAGAKEEEHTVFTTCVALVNVDRKGHKVALPDS
ncbi:MAG: acyl-CoA thioesterase [Candidatus Pacebacteria bacterium]|nr:acyl-CoA thioesterase [Candidatus Paceibacterota bacterium]